MIAPGRFSRQERDTLRRVTVVTVFAVVLFWPSDSFAEFAFSGAIPNLLTYTVFLLPAVVLVINAWRGYAETNHVQPITLRTTVLDAVIMTVAVTPLIVAAGIVGAVPAPRVFIFLGMVLVAAGTARVVARSVVLLVEPGVFRLVLVTAALALPLVTIPSGPILAYATVMQVQQFGNQTGLPAFRTALPTLIQIGVAGGLAAAASLRARTAGSGDAR